MSIRFLAWAGGLLVHVAEKNDFSFRHLECFAAIVYNGSSLAATRLKILETTKEKCNYEGNQHIIYRIF